MIAGVSLIQRVYERAAMCARASAVYVATDDDRIAEHVVSFGGRVVRPAGEFQSGTDRIAASLDLLDQPYDHIVNVQGDEPLIDVSSVDKIFVTLSMSGVDMATLSCPIETDEEFQSRDVVKVVTAVDGDALYFSRAPIPFFAATTAGAPAPSPATRQRHIGLYGYQAGVLRALAMLPPSSLERAESLEQLRALQNGFKIRVVQTEKPHLGVDRPEDVARVESELARSNA
jgi:3-deoxy-manno-octulosonate cytidylyltransferase (CMP-KDO synthetase)